MTGRQPLHASGAVTKPEHPRIYAQNRAVPRLFLTHKFLDDRQLTVGSYAKSAIA